MKDKLKYDIFEKYQDYHEYNPVPRPQPIDFVLEYFDYKQSGVYIDVGAYDGITWSNSVALDELLNWKGICIEPNPTVFEKLKSLRPNAQCINAGCYSYVAQKKFWKITGRAEMLSGFKDNYDSQHIERINRETKACNGTIEEIEIPIITLQNLIVENDIKQVDYLSVDVEGAELEVLKGLGIYTPHLISVEDNGYTAEPHNYLLDIGYRFLKKVAGDCFYRL